MFNIIFIPIVYLSNTGAAPSLAAWWVFGDTFDIYPNNAEYYQVNIWSGYNAATTGSGSNFIIVSGSPNSFSGYGLTTGIIYRQYKLINDTFDNYLTGQVYKPETLNSGFLTGSYWIDKVISGNFFNITSLNSYVYPETRMYNDLFDSYQTGRYTGQQLNQGFFNLTVYSGTSTGILTFTGVYP